MNTKAIKIICAMLACLFMFSILASASSSTKSDFQANAEYESATSTVTQWKPQKGPNTQGDLTLEALKTAVLNKKDIPEFITNAQIQTGGHVHRLYAQEEDLNTVVFQNRDGSKTMYRFSEPIKYIDKDGSIKDKKTTLTKSVSGYELEQNDISLHMPKILSDGISISANNLVVTMKPYDQNKSDSLCSFKNTNTLEYSNVFGDGTSIQYTPTLSGLKEDIILEKYTGKNTFSFIITTNGYPVIKDTETCYVADPLTGEKLASFGEVIIFDAANKSIAGTMDIETITPNHEYILTIYVDASFLKDPSTQYPVTVDPTMNMIVGVSSQKSIVDALIYPPPSNSIGTNVTNSIGTNVTNTIGNSGSLGDGQLIMRFPGILNIWPVTYQYYTVTKAELGLCRGSSQNPSNTLQAYYHTQAVNWTENPESCATIGYDRIGSLVAETNINDTDTIYYLDITSAFLTWKNNATSLARGIVLKVTNPDAPITIGATENSAENLRPFLRVTYIDVEPKVCILDGNITISKNSNYFLSAYYMEGDYTFSRGQYLSFTVDKPDYVTINTYGYITALDRTGQVRITVTSTRHPNVSSSILVTIIEDTKISWMGSASSVVLNNEDASIDHPVVSYNLKAQVTVSGVQHDEDELIEYSIKSIDESLREYLTIDPDTGVLRIVPNLTYYTTGQAHPTGTAVVRASYKNRKSIYKETTVSVVCNDMPDPANSSPIPLYIGRYIRIPNQDQAQYNVSETMETMLNSHYNGTANNIFATVEKNFANEPGWDHWLVCRDNSNPYLYTKFFEYIRASEITWIYSHGLDGALLVNSQEEVTISAEDIYNLHEGYFNNCKLVVYAACETSTTHPSNSLNENILDATLAKGASVAGGYITSVSSSDAYEFAEYFLKFLGTNTVNNGTNDPILDENGEELKNLSFAKAVDAAQSETRTQAAMNFRLKALDAANLYLTVGD